MKLGTGGGGLGMMGRTLRSRNFRLYFAGQGASLIGTWMQLVAMSWLVYRLTGSELLLGVVGFTSQAPIFFLAPVAGVLVDEWDRRRILLLTQTLSLVQALALAGLTLSGRVEVWHIIALSLLLGLVNALDGPARHSFFVQMIDDRHELGHAIALNSSLVNGARLVGPALAGLLIGVVGEGVCFLINAASFAAIIAALLAMRITAAGGPSPHRDVLSDLRQGFRYVIGFPPLRAILLLLGLVSLMGMPVIVLMPVFAKTVFHGGPHTLGYLMSASGAGALAAAVYLALRQGAVGLNRWILWAGVMFAVGTAGFALTRGLGLALGFLVLAGFGMMVQQIASNTVLQLLADDDKRGRLMSFYTMAFMGMPPFGSLLAGILADRIGAPHTILICAFCLLLGAAVYALRLPDLRRQIYRVYDQKGIVHEKGAGTELPLH